MKKRIHKKVLAKEKNFYYSGLALGYSLQQISHLANWWRKIKKMNFFKNEDTIIEKN